MQTTIDVRRERSSTEVEEVLQSRHRRQTSGSLGKRHFTLAPRLVHGHQSYEEPISIRRDNVQTSSRSRHVASRPTPSSSTFEDVPRSISKPIMSRLPLGLLENDAVAANPTKAGNLDYLSLKGGELARLPGTHARSDVARSVTYTRARLPELDEESQHLWEALHSLRNLSDDYADGYNASSSRRSALKAPHPIADGMNADDCPAFSSTSSSSSQQALSLVRRIFNWHELPDLDIDDENIWYGVAFRSKRQEGSESINLYEADRRSHEEAVNSGGLLMYWYGTPNKQTGHNLATCVWTNRQDALRASSLPLHARAAAHSLKAYESFELHRYALRKVRGETKLRLEEWIE